MKITVPMDSSFDFDTPVERSQTGSLKWDKYRDRDVIPLWVADMDFRSPPAVMAALHRRIDHGVFGYTLASEKLNDLIVGMLEKEYAWQIKAEWIIWLPGLVTGINVVCRAAAAKGDDIITAVPVYPPFLTAPEHFQRNLIRVPLSEYQNQWTFDFDRLEESLTPRSRLFILCNPHNPVGRVFTRRELEDLAAVCEKHDLIICSDEIHCGLILDDDKRHIPIASLDPATAARTITLMAPSKTFNLPGLGCAFAIVPDSRLRQKIKDAMAGIVPMVNTLGYTATEVAFRDCADWHAALLAYLRTNRDLVAEVVKQIPNLSIAPVEATYLAWVDVRSAPIEKPFNFFEDAGVGLQDGVEFDGPGFLRLNFGCPKSLLEKALARISIAMKRLT